MNADPANQLMAYLRATGFTLAARDGKLLVTPANRMDDELRAELTAAKADMLELLVQQPANAMERYLSIHSPTVGCGVVIERGPGQYAVVSLADYQEGCGEQA